MPGKHRVLGIAISHPDKVLWPQSAAGSAVTKLDLAKYIERVADRMMPHVSGRPLSVVRAPDGIRGERFYQRHAPLGTAVPMVPIKVKGESKPYFGVDSQKGLVALAQQAVLEIHPWGCRHGDPETPERVIFDLDPSPGLGFADVVAGAKDLKTLLEKLGFTPFVKTTGGKGLHVVIAIRDAGWEEARDFAKAVALRMADDDPHHYTASLAKNARRGRIFIDYLRNNKTATGVAPWSPRAREGATIAAPLAWASVTARLNPKAFTIRTVAQLLRKPDPWKGLSASVRPITAAMKKLEKKG